MSKALDLSPFLVFIVMLAGASLGGIAGIILAIPITGVVHVMYSDYKNRNQSIHEVSTETTKKGNIKRKVEKN